MDVSADSQNTVSSVEPLLIKANQREPIDLMFGIKIMGLCLLLALSKGVELIQRSL